MNRKEFKKLLVEWNQNFINERGLNLPVGMSIKKPELQKGHLISLSFEEAGNLFNHILDYIEEKEVEEFKDVSDNASKFDESAIIIFPKNETIKEILLASENEKIKSRLGEAFIDNEVVFIMFAEGDSQKEYEGQTQDEIGSYVVHDIEHALFSHRMSADPYITNAVKNQISSQEIANKLKDPNMFFPNILGNSSLKYFEEGDDKELIQKFLRKTGDVPEDQDAVEANDLYGPIFSFCYRRMENEKDFKLIKDLSSEEFTDEEKKKLEQMFERFYKVNNPAFSEFKEIFKNCVIIVAGF